MALTPTQEVQVLQLIAQQTALLSLAGNEATITSKLAATKANLSQLTAASSIADGDLMLIRQGSTDRNFIASLLKAYAQAGAVLTTGAQTIAGVKTFSDNVGVAVTPSSWLGPGYIDFPGNGFVGNATSFGGNSFNVGVNAYYASGAWRYKASTLPAQRLDFFNGLLSIFSAPAGNANDPITFTTGVELTIAGQLRTRTTGGGALMDAYACRAWVNFIGTGTVAIRASGNLSSVTDNGVGDYTMNFTTPMPDANYAMIGSTRNQATGAVNGIIVNEHFDTAKTASAIRISVKQVGTFIDVTGVDIAIFR